MSGWFAVKHGITEHPIFKGQPMRLGAWIWILDNTAWADTKQDVGGEIITIRRGELCASQAMMETGSGLSRQQLRTFLEVLRKEGVIKTRPATKSTKARTIVTVCNYEKYQTPQPSSNQEATKQQPTKEQDNNIPVGNGASAPSDSASVIFSSGLRLLAQSGVKDRSARALLGKWRKDHDDAALIAAIGRCEREAAVDPVAFITGALKFHKKQSGQPQDGDIRDFNGIRKVYHPALGGWVREYA